MVLGAFLAILRQVLPLQVELGLTERDDDDDDDYYALGWTIRSLRSDTSCKVDLMASRG
jgi:hypothetical protein